MEQLIKRETTRAKVNAQKKVFIEVLRTNGGNVSKALLAANLKRTTAYRLFKEDQEFANEWIDAQELATDELFTECRRRAVEGVERPVYQNGKLVGTVREYSDTLLIFALKQAEARHKWRNRLIKTGNVALQAVRDRGMSLGLTPEQIDELELAMREQFKGISLI